MMKPMKQGTATLNLSSSSLIGVLIPIVVCNCQSWSLSPSLKKPRLELFSFLFAPLRYHALDANFHASWTKARGAPWIAPALEGKHGIACKERLGQISKTSVSFHLKGHPGTTSIYLDDGLRRYHAILYGLCTNRTRNDAVVPVTTVAIIGREGNSNHVNPNQTGDRNEIL